MRKRICNKVLLKFISVGAFFLGGEEMGKLPVSHVLFWGGVGGGAVGKVPVSHTKNLSHLHFSFKNQEMARQPITYGPHFFPLKVTVIEGLLMFFFSVAVKNEGRFTKENSLKRRIFTPVY